MRRASVSRFVAMSDDAPTRRVDPEDYANRAGLVAGRRVFDRYTLEAVAGRGGMGVVWRARDDELGETVALKFLPEVIALDPAAVDELRQETRRARRLTHANIVRIYDFARDDAMAAVSMEYVDGRTMTHLRVEQPGKAFAADTLAPLVAQLCAALEYAHEEARIVHRDLKPANLLVTHEGRLKVTDFGIARSLSESHTRLTGQASSTSGTLSYMSPQQLSGERPMATDDIYALGATLYELLTGKPPFFRGDACSLMTQIKERAPEPLGARRAELAAHNEVADTLPPIPDAWQETILACLAKNPEDRPQSVSEVARRLKLTTDFADGPEKEKRLTGVGPGSASESSTSKDHPDAAVRRVVRESSGPGSDDEATRRVKREPASQWPNAKRASRWLWIAGAIMLTLGALAYAFWPRGGSVPAKGNVAPDVASGPSASANRPAGSGGRERQPPDLLGAPSPVSNGRVEPVPPPQPRGFTVTVDPPDVGAMLWLGPLSNVEIKDGRALLKDLPDGELELTVQAQGYQPFTTRVTVKDGCGSVGAKLVPVRGAVSVTARPGTQVSAVDERGRETRVGSVPPGGVLEVADLLTVGRYTVKLDHADCAPVSVADVELLIGRTSKVAPAQEPLPGELRVFSVPTGAEVRVNGAVAGSTPATIKKQPSEQALRVEVFQRGYRRIEQSVTLKPREVRTVNIGTMVPESGGIELRFGNSDLRLGQTAVSIDGKPIGRGAVLPAPSGDDRAGTRQDRAPTTPLRIDNLEVGSRTVEIADPDFEPWRQAVMVRDQEDTKVDVVLKAKPGAVECQTTPAGARVTISGGDRHDTTVVDSRTQAETLTPLKVMLPPGTYTLRFDLKGYKAATRTVIVAANRTAEASAGLEKQAYPAPGQAWENTLGMKFVPIPGTGVLFAIWDTRVQDFEAFVNASNYEATGGMYSLDSAGQWGQHGATWRNPGFTQSATHPVCGVSWDDAKAFCRWLTEKERREGRLAPNQEYRLPTDAEWSVAVGLSEPASGTPEDKNMRIAGVYPWGAQWPPPRNSGNYADETAKRKYANWSIIPGYDDGFADTSPVGSFAANRFGLYDMGGNVWQWCEDFYNGSNGSRVLRGGSFDGYASDLLLSSCRLISGSAYRYYGIIGFRCVVVVPAPVRDSRTVGVTAAASPFPQPAWQRWVLPAAAGRAGG